MYNNKTDMFPKSVLCALVVMCINFHSAIHHTTTGWHQSMELFDPFLL